MPRFENPPYYITAYGLAVKRGFKGTLDEWLVSLKGDQGDKVELRYLEDKIQWRWIPDAGATKESSNTEDTAEESSEDLTNDYEWRDLIDVAEIRGEIIEQTLDTAQQAVTNADRMATRASEAADTATNAQNAAEIAAEAAKTSETNAWQSAEEAAIEAAAAAASAATAADTLKEQAETLLNHDQSISEFEDKFEKVDATLQDHAQSIDKHNAALAAHDERLSTHWKRIDNVSTYCQELDETKIKAPSTAAVGQTIVVKTVDEDGTPTEWEAVDPVTAEDLDNIKAILENKVDDAYVEDGYLYLTAGGESVAGPLGPFSGNGSGGGSSNNAVLTLQNTTGWLYKSIAQNTSCKLTYSWSSLENDVPTGNGAVTVKVGGIVRYSASVEQGEKDVDVASYLTTGSNSVRLSVSDVYGNSRTLAFTINVISLSITSSFDNTVAHTGSITFPYTPVGAVQKTVHFILDGVEIGQYVTTASGRQQTYTIPAQSHGSHTWCVYFEADIDGDTVQSNKLYYDLPCIEDGNTSPIIASSFQSTEPEQYVAFALPYSVYDPLSLTASVTLLANGEEVNTLTVDRTTQVWSYRPDTAGDLTLTIKCVGSNGEAVTKDFALTVAETKISAVATTNDLSLYLSAAGRSNNEDTPACWTSGDIEAVFTDFNFKSDGWQVDEDGVTLLRVAGDARLVIPYQIFASDPRTTGKTIEIEFATRNVTNYDAVLFTCWSGGQGLEITAQNALLKSAQSEISTPYKEEEHIRLSFVIGKRADHRLLLAYINGIMSGAVQYPDNDSFSQADPAGISIGSNDCITDIYCIRVYDNDLTRYQILDNWIADTQVGVLRKDRFERNNIYDDYGRITIDTIKKDLPYLVLKASVLPQYKGDKRSVDDSFTDPVHPQQDYSSEGTEIDVQGTSSQYYYRKNYKLKYKNGFVLYDGTTVTVYAMNENAVPVAVFTMKADVASSEGYYNVVTAKLFSKYHPFKMPAQEEDPRTRYSIDGHPIVIFWDNGEETVFLGKYNFNNDKGTPEPFGLSEGDERWEVLQNGTPRVGFHSADFSDDSWKEDFEGNYPDGNTDLTNLQPMCAWVTSTDTEQATGETIDAVTYNGVEYTEDTAEYRLAKFDAELADHFIEDAVIYYMVFTEAFLCMDQREKNVLWRYIEALKLWLADYYDADSIIGHNNQAQPVFDYWMEDIDYTASGDPVFNGQNSTFWKNLRATRADAAKAEWHRLRKAGFSYESVMADFEEHKSQWSEAIYNEDMQAKCLDALIDNGDSTYLSFLRGDKWAWTQWWLYNRFRYLDSKYEYLATSDGDTSGRQTTIRTNVLANLTLTYYIKMYGVAYYNAERVALRVEKDTPYEFVTHLTGAEDIVIGLNDPDMITDLGDLSVHQVELIDPSKMVRLKSLKLGDASEDYENLCLTSLPNLGNNDQLRIVDVRNCKALTDAVDASGCTGLEEAYFDGTAITGLSLPNGGNVKILHLPGTIKNLTLQNLTKLTDFSVPSYANIKTLRLENNSDIIDPFTILNEISQGSHVRIIGFDREMTNSELSAFLTKLDTMRGLDESGNEVSTAQVSGRIYVEEINSATLAKAKEYVGLTVEYGSEYLTSARLVERTLSGYYSNDRVTKVGSYAFRGCISLTDLRLPNVVSLAHEGLANLTLDTLEVPAVTEVGPSAFMRTTVPRLTLPSVTRINQQWALDSFKGNVIDFLILEAISGKECFSGAASSWYALILRNTANVCTLNAGVFGSNGVLNAGTAYIYVPSALIEDYKAATNWSTYADQFRALEDYTVDGTVTGELDETKI